MLEYDRINASEGIDVNKTNVSLRCIVCKCFEFVKVNLNVSQKHAMIFI